MFCETSECSIAQDMNICQYIFSYTNCLPGNSVTVHSVLSNTLRGIVPVNSNLSFHLHPQLLMKLPHGILLLENKESHKHQKADCSTDY